jgi:hypothetical protein
MSGAIPPLPQYAFMASCSFKAQGHLYLYLYLTRSEFNILINNRTEEIVDITAVL